MTSPASKFPAPTRALLQPSIHGRGVRPYVYPGEMDDFHAPGVLRKNGTTRGAVDTAWLCERLLQAPATEAPPVWPGVAGAAERARALAQETKLYRYQQDGAAFLAERDYALLADQMGCGKTCQALVAAEARLSLGVVPTPQTPVVLIVCPALAKRHWQREVKRWTGHEATVLDGLEPTEFPQTRYVICNYDILYGGRRADAAGKVFDVEHLPGWGATLAGRFLIVIFDEAHVLRGRGTRRGTAAKALCKGVPVVWMLTGTPMPNYVRDLWAPVDIMSDGLFGGYWTWSQVYCDGHKGTYGYDDRGSARLDELGPRLSYFVLGRTMEVAGLELPAKRREVYRIDVSATAPSVDAVSQQKAVANGLRATARAKRSAVVSMTVDALTAAQKVIVFCYMREQADSIAKDVKTKLPNASVFCTHGEMTSDGRDAQATNFRAAQAPAVFVATVDSVGVAISLVGAELMIFADLVPEPWKLLQAEGRGHRHGSTTPILVRYVIATGTIDEGIVESVIEKLSTIEQTLGKEANSNELGAIFGGKTDETIVENLFAKLKAWKEAERA